MCGGGVRARTRACVHTLRRAGFTRAPQRGLPLFRSAPRFALRGLLTGLRRAGATYPPCLAVPADPAIQRV